MNISYNWLKQYIKFDYSPEQLSGLLTGCGLEVESMETFESVKGGLEGLIVGEVKEKVKHPNADRLSVCKVDIGTGELSQIVCGAPNVDVGQKVIVATPGITLYPLKGEPFQIKKSKIRGESSEGMICAEDEIGLGESHDGILVLPAVSVTGSKVKDLFKIETDHVLSIGLTPNRSDAASHIGVARDLKAVANTLNFDKVNQELDIVWPDLSGFKAPATKPVISVKVEDKACYRYSGIHIEGIKVAPSPAWLQNKLRAIGLSPINNVVDITNYVLFEYGQPLHAFDAGKIDNKEIIVKRLPKGTKFTTLDDAERTLNGTEMMICDASGGLCIAGVFGGVGSGVTESTGEVFLESAYFDSVSVRTTSKYHQLKTDASFRFERGTDPEMTLPALKRAALLICEIAGGTISSEVVDVYPEPVKDVAFDFEFSKFEKLTGVKMPETLFTKILNWLDIKTNNSGNGIYKLTIPSYRVDVTREADVVEEVLRVYGYDRIPLPDNMKISLPSVHVEPLEKLRDTISNYLVCNGFIEVMANSLYRSSVYGENENDHVKIKNPLSRDLDTLRKNMMYPLLDTVLYNRNRKRTNLRLFEYGKTYHKTDEGIKESDHLSIIISGVRNFQHWNFKEKGFDNFYLKSVIGNALKMLNIDSKKLKWEIEESDILTNCLQLKFKKYNLVTTGSIRKKVLKKFDLDGEIWFADIHLDAVKRILNREPRTIMPPPRFPEVQRDLSMILDQSLQYQSLENLAFETEKKLLKEVNLFDVYEGDKMEKGKKSYALSFTLRDDEKTLTDKEIDKVMNKLMENFEKKLGAVIRRG